CGWIDGVRKSLAKDSYTIRFTPRKPRSTWSSVNIKRAGELTALGRMRLAGLKAFEERAAERSGVYAYEWKDDLKLDDADERLFQANQRAWDFFQSQALWYRRTALWWVISAKKEETQQRRLAILIVDSERGRTIPPLTRRPALERPPERVPRRCLLSLYVMVCPGGRTGAGGSCRPSSRRRRAGVKRRDPLGTVVLGVPVQGTVPCAMLPLVV